jgi:hypothetical protein
MIKWANRISWATLAVQLVVIMIRRHVSPGGDYSIELRLITGNIGLCFVLGDWRSVQTGVIAGRGRCSVYRRDESPLGFWFMFLLFGAAGTFTMLWALCGENPLIHFRR